MEMSKLSVIGQHSVENNMQDLDFFGTSSHEKRIWEYKRNKWKVGLDISQQQC